MNPTTAFWTTRADQIELLEMHLDNLLRDGYRSSDIVILSVVPGAQAAASLPQPWSHRLSRIQNWTQPHGGYATVASFKGLEAPAVIVTDIDRVKSDREESLLYVALSRATDRLILLSHESAKPDLWNLFSRSGQEQTS